ncbi:hypothetical protein ABZ722_34855 [Streptomyces longwoodensis]|uniref:hypothetical protein n=1 Tax=Streptomyces longwoodensis TaxID=68231 RepID=UPI0033DD7E39
MCVRGFALIILGTLVLLCFVVFSDRGGYVVAYSGTEDVEEEHHLGFAPTWPLSADGTRQTYRLRLPDG